MPVTRVMLEYVHPWPNHAGLFLARRNGGFARAGLDVELISDGYDRGGAPAMLARGEYDVASLRLGHVLQSRSTGVPFVAVATLNQRQLGAVITTPATGISRFADLEGKTVAVPPVARLIHEVREAVAADGGDPTLIRFADPGNWEPDVRSVEQGLYDAVMNVRAWEPFQGNTPLDKVVVLEFGARGHPGTQSRIRPHVPRSCEWWLPRGNGRRRQRRRSDDVAHVPRAPRGTACFAASNSRLLVHSLRTLGRDSRRSRDFLHGMDGKGWVARRGQLSR